MLNESPPRQGSAVHAAGKISNIFKTRPSFQVLQTTSLSQSAIMNLPPGASSGAEKNSHPHSDQTLVVLLGMLSVEIAENKRLMHRGDSVTIPAGTQHRFVNVCKGSATTFIVYSPPAYAHQCEQE